MEARNEQACVCIGAKYSNIEGGVCGHIMSDLSETTYLRNKYCSIKTKKQSITSLTIQKLIIEYAGELKKSTNSNITQI